MPSKLVVNSSELEYVARQYEDAENDLRRAISNLDKAVMALKNSDWKSGASSVYFSNYDAKWKESMQKCAEMMRFMREALDFAAGQYEGLPDDMKEYILYRM